jgi:hypothetical protein
MDEKDFMRGVGHHLKEHDPHVTRYGTVFTVLTLGLTIIALLSQAVYSIVNSPSLLKESAVDSCPGYRATKVYKDGNRITGADLELAGEACNAYGTDLVKLKLVVEYQARESVGQTLSLYQFANHVR